MPVLLLLLALAVLAAGGGWLVTRGPAALAQVVGPTDRPLAVDGAPDAPAAPPGGATPEESPGTGDDPPAPREVTGLDPELVARFEAAWALAAADGIELRITSGWRSADEQQALVDQAVARYGSEAEAHRWVLPPEVSAHVQGLAIDVGPTEGVLWLGDRQQETGLCRTYANESWHFELTGPLGDPCPEPWPDASHGWR